MSYKIERLRIIIIIIIIILEHGFLLNNLFTCYLV